jgi:lysophospholipase L1-like esterase
LFSFIILWYTFMEVFFLSKRNLNIEILIKTIFCIVACMFLMQGAIAQKKKLDPVITWHNPAPITYGTALRSVQLNATANVDGTFKYTPGAGTQLNAGTHTLSTTFTPKDKSKYNIATATVTLIVSKASATLSLSNLSQSYDGSPKPVAVTSNPAGLSGITVTYNGSDTAPTPAGSYAVVASLHNENYQAANATGTLIISKTTLQKVSIVVLGSSTAAGTGANSYSNSWVGLLTTRLNNDYPGMITLTNFAVGGYTTYHILPTGTSRVSGRPAVDPARNITAALDLSPQIVIINMPSNDVANGYSDNETLTNFANVINAALSAGVKVFLTGTQPRSDIALSIRPRLQSQNQSLLSIYGNDCLNIYDELTDLAAYTIKTKYSSGDNIHLNNAGHNYIYTQVLPSVKTWIDAGTSLSYTKVSSAKLSFDYPQELQLSTFPNPFTDIIYIQFKGVSNGKVMIELFDIKGVYINTLYEGEMKEESEMGITMPSKKLSQGVYILRFKIGNQVAHKRLMLER